MLVLCLSAPAFADDIVVWGNAVANRKAVGTVVWGTAVKDRKAVGTIVWGTAVAERKDVKAGADKKTAAPIDLNQGF